MPQESRSPHSDQDSQLRIFARSDSILKAAARIIRWSRRTFDHAPPMDRLPAVPHVIATETNIDGRSTRHGRAGPEARSAPSPRDSTRSTPR